MTDAEVMSCRFDGELLRSFVNDRVRLKKAGRDHKGCCPFHNEKEGSFTCYDDGHFHCYGCHAHGDVFAFVMRTQGVRFPEAADIVASARGLTTNRPRARKLNGNGNGHDHGEAWFPVMPPPADAPPPDLSGCSACYEYVAADGRLLFYQRRFERGGDKKFGQKTYGTLTDRQGRTTTGWQDKGPPQPHPLFRLDRLTGADPDTLIIVVEGEKACMAAERLFPDAIVVTWLNGAASVHLTDWEPLRRFRRIVWWQDADLPKDRPHGSFIATPAFRERFPGASFVDTAGLEDIKDGWDAADLEAEYCADPEAWLTERLRQWDTQTDIRDPNPDTDPEEISLADLQNEEIEELRWIVPDFIPEGLTVFAGRPKIGKSWLMLGTALGVARGTEALGKLVAKRDVLYCGLEDGKRRMKARTDKLLPSVPFWPDNFTFRYRLAPLDQGGMEVLEKWCIEHPNGGLIVIDVLGKVRGQKGRNEDPYQYDYRLLSGLQQLAIRYRIAIVVVHHVRKTDADDVLDTISGTVGIAGIADTALVLGQTSDGIRLAGRGRDTENIDKLLEFDEDTCLWSVIGEYDEARPDSETSATRRQVFDLLEASPLPLTPAKIAERLGRSRSLVRKVLRRMLGHVPSQVEQNLDGSYTVPGRNH